MIKSPYNLLQEIYNEHPWKMLVCCIMLNCTSRKQVDQIREQFFKKYPDAIFAENANPTEMEELLAPLGFKTKRTKIIQRFSNDWINLNWKDPIELYGIGKYGQDSWEIFQNENFNIFPTDGVLKTYLTWAKTQDLSKVK